MLDIDIRTWLPAINILGTFALAGWLYFERRSDKTNTRVDALFGQVAELEKSVATLAATATVAPNHADLTHINDAISTLSATVNQLVGESHSQSDQLRLILNKIMNQGVA